MNPIVSVLAFSLLLSHATAPPPPKTPSFHQVTNTVGKAPLSIAIADVNHDRFPDILVADAESETVTVLLGDGHGHFVPAHGSPFPAGHLPNDIGVADMNGDGNLDLIIANHQTPYISVLLGDGKGAFHPAPGSPVNVHSDPHPHGVAVQDFNGDGKPDVVTDSWATNQIELLLGDGNGRLGTPGTFFSVGHRPYQRLRSADFNKDGHPDVVTTNLDDDTVTILLGDGKGGFYAAPHSPFHAGAKPWAVAIDDLNKNGNSDLVIIPYDRDVANASQIAVTILSGDGRGGFTPMRGSPLPLSGCSGSHSVAIGDFEGGGYRDIVVACALSKNLVIFKGSREGKFTASTQASKGGWGGIAVADLNGDGKDDLVTADNNDGTITIFLSK